MSVVIANPGSRRRRWALFLVAFVLLMLVVYAGLDVWTGRRLQSIAARLEQRYGTMNDDSLRAAPVPPEENRARLVRAAAALSAPQSDAVRAFISQAAKSETIPPIPAEVRAFVESNREALSIASTFGARERTSWDIEPDGSNTPDLLEIRMLSNLLYASAMIDLDAKRPDDAARAIAAGLAVSSSLRNENQLIAQLIRIAIDLHQTEAIKRLLAVSAPPAAALEELAKRLAENRSPDPLRLGLIGEMKHFDSTIARFERGRPVDGPRMLPRLGRFGRPLIRFARGSYLQAMEGLIE